MEMKLFLKLSLILSLFVFSSSCNFFTEISNRDTDEAILFHVQSLINEGKYADAIARWGMLTAKRQTERAPKLLLASAYAARGGLDVILLSQSLSGTSTKTVFKLLLSAFKGKTAAHYTDMQQAQTILLGISPAASGRTTDENIFMLFIQLAKLGTLFSKLVDADKDGNVDATFTTCAVADIPNSDANEVVAAIGNIMDTIAVTGSVISSTSLTNISTACTTLDSVAGISFCSVTDPNSSSITALVRQVARTLIAESALMIGLELNPGTYEFSPPAAAGSLCP